MTEAEDPRITFPLPSPESQIAIDSEHVIHSAERDTRHGLSHLEDEFIDYWRKMATFSETEAKRLLEWLASKV